LTSESWAGFVAPPSTFVLSHLWNKCLSATGLDMHTCMTWLRYFSLTSRRLVFFWKWQ